MKRNATAAGISGREEIEGEGMFGRIERGMEFLAKD
jgi:hypothetical protein